MGTKNRRVAGYLPALVYEKFQQLKLDRQFGDSQALIHVFSEYFGVSQLVSYHDSPEVLERIQALESAMEKMQEEMLELRQSSLDSPSESPSTPSSKSPEVSEDQLVLLDVPKDLDKLPSSDSSDDVEEGLDGWVSMKEAWNELGCPGGFDTFRKRTPEDLREKYGLQVSVRPGGKYKRHFARKVLVGSSSDDF
jgi:hypothetical protein